MLPSAVDIMSQKLLKKLRKLAREEASPVAIPHLAFVNQFTGVVMPDRAPVGSYKQVYRDLKKAVKRLK